MFSLYGIGGVLIILALIHFIRRRPDFFWLFVILFLGPIGAIIYLVVEAIPDFSANRGEIAWLERRRRTHRLEAEVRQNPTAGNFEELGMLYLDAHDFARAKSAYDRALAQRTDSIDTFYRRALCEIELSQFQAAATDLDHVVQQDANYDFGRALGLYAHCLANLGDSPRAAQMFEAAASRNTSSEFMVHYADFLTTQGRRDQAREWARKVLEKRPLMPAYQRRRERKWLRRAAQLA